MTRIRFSLFLCAFFLLSQASFAQNNLSFSILYSNANIKDVDSFRNLEDNLALDVFSLDNYYLNPSLRGELSLEFAENFETSFALGFSAIRSSNSTTIQNNPLVIKHRSRIIHQEI